MQVAKKAAGKRKSENLCKFSTLSRRQNLLAEESTQGAALILKTASVTLERQVLLKAI